MGDQTLCEIYFGFDHYETPRSSEIQWIRLTMKRRKHVLQIWHSLMYVKVSIHHIQVRQVTTLYRYPHVLLFEVFVYLLFIDVTHMFQAT